MRRAEWLTEEVCRFAANEIALQAYKHGVPVDWIRPNNGNAVARKDRKTAAARQAVIYALRTRVYRYRDGGVFVRQAVIYALRTRVYRYRDGGVFVRQVSQPPATPMRFRPPMSYPAIADLMQLKNHTTAKYAFEREENRLAQRQAV